MLAFISAIEPLRIANRLNNNHLFDWKCFSLDGENVASSGGIEFPVNGSLKDIEKLDMLFVCGGMNIQDHVTSELLGKLRKSASYGMEIGSMCTGSYILAKSGLLNGHRCTIHWENISGLKENFPELEVTSELFEIDGKFYTCSGGTASIDLFLSIISTSVNHDTAVAVSEQIMHHRIREGGEGQRMEIRARLGISHPKLLAAIACMEENIEAPYSCSELASEVGLSVRQLERLFQKYLSCSPTRYYLRLRLDRARHLLTQTSLPIIEIAMASGFVSASHFSKCHREYFGRTPSEERRTRN